MKRIATLTTHAALNYGAVLQAYALQQYIRDQGCACEVLNYVPTYISKYYALIQRPTTIRSLLLSLYQARHSDARAQRQAQFERFRQTYLHLSGPVLSTHDDLVHTANGYDLILCGSDQIWNPAIHGFDEGFFLSFPDFHAEKVSYAASFGQDMIEEAIKPELRRRLTGFSAFSCREHSACLLLRELTGQDPTMVLDPVFLLTPRHWRSMKQPIYAPKTYALAYFLSDPGQSPFALKRYAKQHGAAVFSIGFSPRDVRYGITCDYSLGPCQFLSAVDGASVILTNSFHCAAFAILFEKNFFIRISRGKSSRNDRLVSLLEDLGLQDRMYYDEDIGTLALDKPIDYGPVKRLLLDHISKSKAFLQQFLTE